MECINNYGVEKALKLNKEYEKLTEDDTCFVIRNELGKHTRYHKSRFRVPIRDILDDLENLHATIPTEYIKDIYDRYTYPKSTKEEGNRAMREVNNLRKKMWKWEGLRLFFFYAKYTNKKCWHMRITGV